MGPTKVLVIVPRLPPSVDGLGDYAMALVKGMSTESEIVFEFLVADPLWQGTEKIDGFKVIKLSSRSDKILSEQLNNYSRVLLNYVGYGYARRGCPFWLIKGLKYWSKKDSGNKLITMFHELYAFGPIWTSQFWTSPFQKWLAIQLMMISHQAFSSKKKYAERIEVLSKGKHKTVPYFPVFSNIGEPSDYIKLNEREKSLIIFGSPGPRRRVYQNSQKELLTVCEKLKIKTIYDIGQRIEECPTSIGNIAITQMGVLPHSEISQLLSKATVGFFNYPTEFLAKSGIFAAYCAHGVLPVGTWYDNQGIDQVESGKHYLLADRLPENMNLDEVQKISSNAFNWYQTHRISIQAKEFLKLFKSKD